METGNEVRTVVMLLSAHVSCIPQAAEFCGSLVISAIATVNGLTGGLQGCGQGVVAPPTFWSVS